MLEMSVIVLAPDNNASARRTMDHLRAQTVREQLGIIILYGPVN